MFNSIYNICNLSIVSGAVLCSLMAHHNAMNTGVMLTSLKNYECASSLKGKTSNGDGVGKYEHELKLDLSRPLGEVLDSIFSLRGRVIIDFPGASYEQVSGSHDQQ